MTLDKIRELFLARPFRPFDVYLADGRKLHVASPEMLVVGGRTVAFFDAPETPEFVDLLLVISLKIVHRTRLQTSDN